MNMPLQSVSSISLPEHLAERVRLVQAGSGNGNLVLYWLQTAMRVDENPALDVARLLAEHHNLPLLIYQGLSQRYRYASDRHHQFILEGARDLQRDFSAQGMNYVFHLETSDDQTAHLGNLADDACFVVTEDLPVNPPRRNLRALHQRTDTPIIAVDTACVVSHNLLSKSYDRAFAFRDATKKLYANRVDRDWPQIEVETAGFDARQLGDFNKDLQKVSFSDLVARCNIDHSIPPAAHSVGGSCEGYRRWEEFKDSGLVSYSNRRNDPLRKGTSRMSPYLHYGMVSPFRIAREASQIPGKGAEKYLDELLIWRELAHHFCFHHPEHERWSVLPTWARETLDEHSNDERKETYTWEELARGNTSDEFWNACQRALVQTGELHNNLRMTWGKAVLPWTKNPRQALKWLIDLNNRFALDGRDPSSFGGILWCFGLFDRPFYPENPVLGSLRARKTSDHGKRLDISEYAAKVKSDYKLLSSRVAVIGAGISGLIAARTLQDHGANVEVFEKSRGVGGRMSTRRTELASYDHGAQYFTARDARFRQFVDSWQELGLVEPWGSVPDDNESHGDDGIVVINKGKVTNKPSVDKRYVAIPGMNAVCKHLSRDVSINLETRIAHVKKRGACLELLDENQKSLGQFDHVVVSAPAEQSAALVLDFEDLSSKLSRIKMMPCWAVMASFEQSLKLGWSGAFIHDSFLSWAARNSSKPKRTNRMVDLVIHASHEWTQDHWELSPEKVVELMLEEFWIAVGKSPVKPIQVQAHRWRYAIADPNNLTQCYFDSENGIAVCGDWANGSRVEGAFLSGLAAFGRIQQSIYSDRGEQKTQKSLFA